MLRYIRRRRLIALITIMTMLTSGMFTTTYAVSSKVTISGNNSPTTLTAGKSFSVKGTIKSNIKIKRVEIGIVNSSGKWTAYKYDNKKVNKKTFSVKKAAKKLKYAKLKKGTYYYRIYAHTTDGKVHIVLNKQFKVISNTSNNESGAKATDVRCPSSIIEGKGFDIKGTITSSKKIESVTVGVTTSSGAWTDVKFTKSGINAKKYDINKLNSNVLFGKLSSGSYRYRIDVTTPEGTKTLINSKFSIVKNTSSTNGTGNSASAVVISSTKAGSVTIDKTVAAISGSNKVQLINVKSPKTYSVGSTFTPAGTLKSEETIKKVEIGIVFKPTNKWTVYKYSNSNVNSNTFDVSKAASKLAFNKLPGGTFMYRIYVHSESGIAIALDKEFVVKPSDKPQKAVNWAIKIANDDSFTYGHKPETSKIGCYFCGTNKRNKPKGYEKTYVCVTFLGAAYAHGAKDPELLSACSRGKMTMYESETNFKSFSCWMKLGTCKELTVADLQPGDVLVKSHAHVVMYVGGDKFVEATSGAPGGCWGPNSIAVKSGMASRLKSMSSNSNNFVMRYIY